MPQPLAFKETWEDNELVFPILYQDAFNRSGDRLRPQPLSLAKAYVALPSRIVAGSSIICVCK
jgi:hypothetical protein